MRMLLDTHIFIWWDSAPEHLTQTARAEMENPSNELFLSVASVWEMMIKHQPGKLALGLPISELIETQRTVNRMEILPVTLPHVLALERLPPHHRDPFDRLLVAQSISEGIAFLTADPFCHNIQQPC